MRCMSAAGALQSCPVSQWLQAYRTIVRLRQLPVPLCFGSRRPLLQGSQCRAFRLLLGFLEALEEGGHGIFTKTLVEGVLGGVDTGDRGYMTSLELFSYVQRGVFAEADRRGKAQTPKCEPLHQMHKKKSCDGQVLFFRDAGGAAAGTAAGSTTAVGSPLNAVRAAEKTGN